MEKTWHIGKYPAAFAHLQPYGFLIGPGNPKKKDKTCRLPQGHIFEKALKW